MLSADEIHNLRQAMIERRDALAREREGLEDSFDRTRERRREWEESAADDKEARLLDHLEDRKTEEILAIDNALQRIEAGVYGQCAGCGETISRERLTAKPWADRCAACAGTQPETGAERAPPPPPPEPGAELNEPDTPGPPDPEFAARIRERIEQDGRVDVSNLAVSCHGAVARIQGELPGQPQVDILREVVLSMEDVDGLVEEIRVRRTPLHPGEEPPPEPGKSEDEILLEGEDVQDVGEDPAGTLQEGGSVRPAPASRTEKK